MNHEIKSDRIPTPMDIVREIRESLPPDEQIEGMIKRYSQLNEAEKLIVDCFYLTRAFGVSSEEVRTFYEALMRGKRVCPGLIDEDHQIRCPVARMRLEKLGPEAQEIFLKVFWGLEEKNEILEEEV